MSRYAARNIVRAGTNHPAAIGITGPILIGPEAAHRFGIPYWRWDDRRGRLTRVHPGQATCR